MVADLAGRDRRGSCRPAAASAAAAGPAARRGRPAAAAVGCSGDGRRAAPRPAPRCVSSSVSKPAVESNGRCSSATSARPSRSIRSCSPGPHSTHLDRDRVGLGGVRVEQLGQQLARRPGLGDQHQPGGRPTPPARRVRRSAAATASSAARPSRSSTDPALGQRHAAARAFEQGDAESPLELLDRPRQRRLGHPEPFGRPAEVQLLRDGDEVAQLAGLHDVHGSPSSRRPGRYRVRYRPPPDRSWCAARRDARSRHD